MASAGQTGGIGTVNKSESRLRTPSQQHLVTPNEKAHSRLSDFIQEPPGAGNRSVMLPDKDTDGAIAIKEARERMRKEIENISNAPSSTSSMASLKIQLPAFQWEVTECGVWQRDIDECETFYRRTARKEDGCYPITGSASFTIKAPNTSTIDGTIKNEDEQCRSIENAFRKAWEVLCYEHPTLRSCIKYDKESGKWKRVYSTFRDREERKNWLGSTFKVADTGVESLRWFNEGALSFDASHLLLVRPKIRDEHQTVFLRCPHDVTDGVGILQLVDQLFYHAALTYTQGSHYALPTWGDEHTRLSPCLRLAANIPASSSETQMKRFEEVQTQNRSTYTHPSLLGLPQSSDATASQHGKRHRLSVLVPKATTEQIILGCKATAPGVSVTHVFMSSLALALSELQPRKGEPYSVRYVNHSMINLRPYCCEPYSTPKHAAAPYHTVSMQALGVDLVVPASSTIPGNGDGVDDLPQIVTKVRDFFKDIRPASPSDEQVALAPLMFKSLTAPPGSDPHDVSEPSFCPVALSSLGNVASIVSATHGPFELENVWAASEPIGSGVAMFLGTWDGKIELSSVFDTRYHDPRYIRKFLERILSCVCKGLGVDRHTASAQVPTAEKNESNKRKQEGETYSGRDGKCSCRDK
ncbi:hypothetical protein F4804DRAFT_335635 [Jackrogersella minutella]|nr:hypothetical protein F4804DRAFT_335635 [Jackrogersella minutella]